MSIHRALTVILGLFGTFVYAHELSAQARIAPEKFIPSFSQAQNPDCPYDKARIEAHVVKYDLIAPTHAVFDKCFALPGLGNSWQTIKTYNHDALIFVYINGPAQYTINQGWPLRADGPASGIAWLKANHGANASDRWTAKGRKFGDYLQGSAKGGYNEVLQMNLKNPNWIQYWIDSFATWNGRPNPYYSGPVSTAGVDGLFSDNTNFPATPIFREGHSDVAAFLDTPVDYALPWDLHNREFHDSALNWANQASNQLAKNGLKLIPNWFFLNAANGLIGPQGWAETDALEHPPFAGMAECANACISGHPLIQDGGGANDLSSSIRTMRDLRKTKVLYDNTARGCASSMDGPYVAINGFSCWDIFWYTMGSFLMGFDTEIGNGYFGFSVDDNIRWYDELDPAYLHLGHQVGTFTNTNGLFIREFEDGWVVVNGASDAMSNIAVPRGGQARVINHGNLKTANAAMLVSRFNLARNRAVILLKPGRNITNADNPVTHD